MRESNKANKDLNNKSKNDEKEAGKVVLQSSWSAREEEILKFWDEKQIFEKSLEKNKGAESFVFTTVLLLRLDFLIGVPCFHLWLRM